MKTLFKVILAFLLLLATSAAVGYALFLKPSPAEDVCAKFFELSLTEARTRISEGSGVAPDEVGFSAEELEIQLGVTRQECVAKEERARRVTVKSGFYVASKSKCEASAKSLAEFERCGG